MESEVQSYLGSEVALGVKVSSGPLLTMLDSCFPLTLGLWRILTFLPICQSSKIDIHIFIYFYLLLVESQLDYLVYRVARNWNWDTGTNTYILLNTFKNTYNNSKNISL